MRRLLTKLLFLGMPLVVWGLFVLCVDPFNYFRLFALIPDSTKKDTIYHLNTALFRVLEYVHDPSPNIIIGDSRSVRLSNAHFNRRTGEQYKHLSVDAGKINEFADLFWFANSRTHLDNVYIVFNFNLFNLYAYGDHVNGVTRLLRNPLLYLYDRSVAEASYLVLEAEIRDQRVEGVKSTPTKDEFWDWGLHTWSTQQYGKWKYPTAGYARLQEISRYCKRYGIKLTFIIVPVHVDYQKKVNDFNLADEEMQFKSDISKLATTYDFDYPNDLTANRDNFSDPVHITMEVGDSIIDEILTGSLRYGRLLVDNPP
jgi:hypothetical protein